MDSLRGFAEVPLLALKANGDSFSASTLATVGVSLVVGTALMQWAMGRISRERNVRALLRFWMGILWVPPILLLAVCVLVREPLIGLAIFCVCLPYPIYVTHRIFRLIRKVPKFGRRDAAPDAPPHRAPGEV